MFFIPLPKFGLLVLLTLDMVEDILLGRDIQHLSGYRQVRKHLDYKSIDAREMFELDTL